jgi:hypothetical protein
MDQQSRTEELRAQQTAANDKAQTTQQAHQAALAKQGAEAARLAAQMQREYADAADRNNASQHQAARNMADLADAQRNQAAQHATDMKLMRETHQRAIEEERSYAELREKDRERRWATERAESLRTMTNLVHEAAASRRQTSAAPETPHYMRAPLPDSPDAYAPQAEDREASGMREGSNIRDYVASTVHPAKTAVAMCWSPDTFQRADQLERITPSVSAEDMALVRRAHGVFAPRELDLLHLCKVSTEHLVQGRTGEVIMLLREQLEEFVRVAQAHEAGLSLARVHDRNAAGLRARALDSYVAPGGAVVEKERMKFPAPGHYTIVAAEASAILPPKDCPRPFKAVTPPAPKPVVPPAVPPANAVVPPPYAGDRGRGTGRGARGRGRTDGAATREEIASDTRPPGRTNPDNRCALNAALAAIEALASMDPLVRAALAVIPGGSLERAARRGSAHSVATVAAAIGLDLSRAESHDAVDQALIPLLRLIRRGGQGVAACPAVGVR